MSLLVLYHINLQDQAKTLNPKPLNPKPLNPKPLWQIRSEYARSVG